MSEELYLKKALKYKIKYQELKKQKGGFIGITASAASRNSGTSNSSREKKNYPTYDEKIKIITDYAEKIVEAVISANAFVELKLSRDSERIGKALIRPEVKGQVIIPVRTNLYTLGPIDNDIYRIIREQEMHYVQEPMFHFWEAVLQKISQIKEKPEWIEAFTIYAKHKLAHNIYVVSKMQHGLLTSKVIHTTNRILTKEEEVAKKGVIVCGTYLDQVQEWKLHKSNLYNIIGKQNPTIGDLETFESYKGSEMTPQRFYDILVNELSDPEIPGIRDEVKNNNPGLWELIKMFLRQN